MELSQTAEGNLFTGMEKGIFKFPGIEKGILKFAAGFCCEISKVLIGEIRGHLNIQQAEKSGRTSSRERFVCIPRRFNE